MHGIDIVSNTGVAGALGAAALFGACLAWGLDNSLTRKVSLTDAAWIASIKGRVAGAANLVLAFALSSSLPAMPHLVAASPSSSTQPVASHASSFPGCSPSPRALTFRRRTLESSNVLEATIHALLEGSTLQIAN